MIAGSIKNLSYSGIELQRKKSLERCQFTEKCRTPLEQFKSYIWKQN